MSDFLFNRSSILSGIGSTIDLFGISPSYNMSKNCVDADRRDYQADIAALRADMDSAIALLELDCRE